MIAILKTIQTIRGNRVERSNPFEEKPIELIAIIIIIIITFKRDLLRPRPPRSAVTRPTWSLIVEGNVAVSVFFEARLFLGIFSSNFASRHFKEISLSF